uniref:Uncharacterized protein n=1 Tax=Romanomermis culicivorax TaxID=13658 RepID=A0A915JUF1_ROMCU
SASVLAASTLLLQFGQLFLAHYFGIPKKSLKSERKMFTLQATRPQILSLTEEQRHDNIGNG